MNEKKKDTGTWVWVLAIFLALWIASILGAAYLGMRSTARQFERHGYVLINGESGEAVATVTPIFQEWGR